MNEHQTLHWLGGLEGHLRLIDQTRLPVELAEIDCRSVEQVWSAIRSLQVRAAPAIGIAAAYGLCLGVQEVVQADEATFFRRLDDAAQRLATSRPTAVNLFWALQRMKQAAAGFAAAPRPKSPPPCWPKPRPFRRKTGKCAGPSAATGPSCSATGRAC